ncbi:hypothetical protein ACFQY4_28265 [Catellatospora bangladeshensis]|uniref:hypothetical protein n=1 Tax=Catellatospora bangladeshensis TaxID=310355 RepID=UPI003614E962
MTRIEAANPMAAPIAPSSSTSPRRSGSCQRRISRSTSQSTSTIATASGMSLELFIIWPV